MKIWLWILPYLLLPLSTLGQTNLLSDHRGFPSVEYIPTSVKLDNYNRPQIRASTFSENSREERGASVFGISLAYSHRLVSIPLRASPTQQELVKEIKRGLALGGDASYYFNKRLGGVLKYNLHLSSAEVSVIGKTKVVMHDVGAGLALRIVSLDGEYLVAQGRLGPVHYREKNISNTSQQKNTFTGNALGSSVSLAYEKIGTGGLGFRIGVQYLYAIIEKGKENGKTTTLDTGYRINLSRVDIGLGILFGK